jgi:hypothetical protein
MALLARVQKELEAKSDLTFELEEIKYGRRVGAIRFHVVAKKRLDAPTVEPPVDDTPALEILDLPVSEFHTDTPLDKLLALVPGQHKAKKTVLTALEAFKKKHGFDYVKRNIVYCNAKAAKSYAGFLSNALKEDWGHDWELEQQQPTKPVKKKVAEIWERQGYASQKEYDNAMFRKQMAQYGKVV